MNEIETNEETLYTLPQLAELCGATYPKARWAVLNGVITPAKHIGRSRFFTFDQIETLRAYFRQKAEEENNEPPCSVVMPFGQYTNQPLNKIKRGYLRWALANCPLSDELKNDIECVINKMPLPERKPHLTLEEELKLAMGRKWAQDQ